MIHTIIERLKGIAAVTDLVPATSITPVTQAQTVPLPAIVLSMESTTTNETKDKASLLDGVNFELLAVAETPGDAWAIANACRDAIDNFVGALGGINFERISFNTWGDSYETSQGTYSIASDYSALIARAAQSPNYPPGLGEPVTVQNEAGGTIATAQPGETVVVNDATVSNSDDSYSESVAPGGNAEVPDTELRRTNGDATVDVLGGYPATRPVTLGVIRVIDDENDFTSVGALKDVRLNTGIESVTETADEIQVDVITANPSGVAYQNVWPTQYVSRANYDAASLRAAGVFDYAPPAYPESFAALDRTAVESDIRATFHGDNGDGTDLLFPTMLKHNNRFGNKYRFTDSLGNPSDSAAADLFAHTRFREHSFTGAVDGYVIDHQYGFGLMVNHLDIAGVFCMNSDGTGQSWAAWLNAVATLTHSTFNDWFVPSMEHCMASAHVAAVCKEPWAGVFFSSHYSGNRLHMLTSTAKSASLFYPIYDSSNNDLIVDQGTSVSSSFTHRLTSVFPIRIDR